MGYDSLNHYYYDSDIHRPIISFDFKVYVMNIAHSVKAYLVKNILNEQGINNYIKAQWAYKLNRGADCLDLERLPLGFTGIIVSDFKGKMPETVGDYGEGYWRNLVANELNLPVYKGNRPKKHDLVLKTLNIGLEYLASNPNFFFFEKEYFEADDLNGELYRIKRSGVAAEKALYLSTVDGDIQALVSNEDKIVWCNTAVFNDRIRGEKEVIDYYLRKEGVLLTHPNQVCKLKTVVGDTGDNLFSGTPLRLFDLLEEDEEYKIDYELKKKLREAMVSNKKSNNEEHMQKAAHYLITRGFKIPEIRNPSRESYNFWQNNIKVKVEDALTFSEVYYGKKAIAA